MASRVAQLGRDALVYGVLDVANRFVGIFLIPLYTRVLVPAEYGILDLVLTLVSIVYVVWSVGLDSALSYRYNRVDSEDEKRRVATTALATGTVLTIAGCAVLILMAGPVARLAIPGVAGAQYLLVLGALALPFQMVTQTQMLLLRLRFAFPRYAILSLGLLLTTVALNVWLVLFLRLGVEGILLAQLGSRALLGLVGFHVCRTEFSREISPGLAPVLVRYGAPLVLANLSYWVVLFLERYALLRMASATEVGLFGIATRVATLVTLVSMAIDIAWMPFAMSIHRERDAPRTYARIFTYYLIAAGLTGTLITVFAREALVLLTQPAYYSAYLVVGPIAGALVVRGAVNIVAIGAMITERTGLLSRSSVVATAFHAVLLLLLIPQAGALGAAFATLLARLAWLGALYVPTQAVFPIPYEWRRIGSVALVLGVSCVLGTVAGQLEFWTGVVVKVLLIVPGTLAALLLTRGVTVAEVQIAGALIARRLARGRAPAAARTPPSDPV
jgi:O-antigen/teichoic acid export membrane protein